MDSDEIENFDAANEINDAMISSLAEVVKGVSIEEENNPLEDVNDDLPDMSQETNENQQEIAATVDELVSEGEAAHRSGDYDNALEIFNRAIALDPSNSMAWFNRGVLLESKQDPKGAKQSFVICLDLDPNHGPALANLAVLLNRLGDNDGSIEIASRALEFFPGHPYLVKILEDNKKAGGVASSTPKVLPQTQEKLVDQNLSHSFSATIEDMDSNSVNLESELDSPAEQKDIIEDNTVNEPIIEESLIEDTIDLDSICNEATLMLSQGDAKGALQILKPYLHAEASANYDAWKIAAGAMASMSLDDHAISAYTHAIGLNSEDEKSFFNLGALHERKSNYEAAIKCFKSALELDGSYSKAAIRIANIAEIIKDIEALTYAKKSLANQDEFKEDYALFLIELAEGEATILENTSGLPPTMPAGPSLAKEAMEYCEPNTKMMARAQSAAGDHTDSVITWKSIIQTDKSNPDLWTGLARALESAGDIGSAQRCHEKAQSLRSTPEPVSQPDALDALMEENEQTTQMSSNEIAYTPPEPTPMPTSVPTPVPTPVPAPVPTFVPNPSEATSVPTPTQIPERPTTNIQPPLQPAPQPTPNFIPELTPPPAPEPPQSAPRPEIDLAAAALEATANMERNKVMDSNSNSIANQDIEWYNKGVGLIEDKKYREALSCFDRALPSFANNDEMVIRILNGRGNALYYLEDYPKCVESYHKAMVINPKGVQGKTLYNMGTAYAEMQRFADAIKCFEQAMPRGLDKSQQKLAKEQIRRCNILQKEQQRKMN
ncbi:MAG: hypothetical protein CMB20_002690 [Methanobacteriota archaeon]|nr:MAG: hypothetical protein CMB20_002690 [Euryarchaeota archaeon]